MAGEAGSAALAVANPWLGLVSSVLGGLTDSGPTLSTGGNIGPGLYSTGAFSVAQGAQARADATNTTPQSASGGPETRLDTGGNVLNSPYLLIGAIGLSLFAVVLVVVKK